MKKPIVLVATSVIYFSAGDEDSFFGWLDRIACVSSYKGEGRSLYIELSRKPRTAELHELMGLFERYKVTRRQLLQCATVRNQYLFGDLATASSPRTKRGRRAG